MDKISVQPHTFIMQAAVSYYFTKIVKMDSLNMHA